uniref:SYMPK_PTA1_N domain-containing protein n=1 Tax=Angiostrongylus cantonensis TaxID=6313 RepID=A0A0K0DL78_ANGCA
MESTDIFVEPLETNDSLADRIGEVIREAQATSDLSQKLKSLSKAEYLLLSVDNSGHLLDNFLDEMLEFTVCHLTGNFILSEIHGQLDVDFFSKKDADVLKKAITNLSYLLMSGNQSRGGIKVIIVCANIYPYILKWACSRKADSDVEKCWDAFSVLKGRIVSHADSDNEGIRTLTFKFLEAIVLSQSLRTEVSTEGSFSVANIDVNRGEDVMSLNDVPRDHRFISYRKLQSEATVNLQSLMDQTSLPHISAQNLLTVLNVLCTISRRRPEYMARILDCLEALHINLPPTLGASQVKSMRKELKAHMLRILKHPSSLPLHPRITTLLTDLGASFSLIMKIFSRLQSGEFVFDDDEYGDDDPASSDGSAAIPDTAHQSAIDITAEFIYERLNPKVVANLVLISLVTLPDEMPAAFASSFTQIATAGTEQHRRHLARSMATQATAQELGPGAEQIRKEKLAKFIGRPYFTMSLFSSIIVFKHVTMLWVLRIHFVYVKNLLNAGRARQGGTMSMHHVVLVRIATRFHPLPEKLHNELIEFIVETTQHRHRTDLALLWVTELYSQYQGLVQELNNWFQFDHYCCFGKLLDKGQHKEAYFSRLFHKLLLDCPLVTSNALNILEKVYGAFGITTLRELLLTRNRQRAELIDLLFNLCFYDRMEVYCSLYLYLELCSLKYMHHDLRLKLIEQLNECALPKPPPHFVKYRSKITDFQKVTEFDETLYRSGIHLYLAILPLDTSLLMPLAQVYTKASTLLKKVWLRQLFFFLFSLFFWKTDVRSLIPILNGLDKEDIVRILPQFILKAAYQNSVGLVFKRLLTGRSELYYEYFGDFNCNNDKNL